MEGIGKFLIIIGFTILIIGILLTLFEKLPLGLGKLPGDIYIKRDNFVFYFPLATSILISIVLSLVLMLISRMSK
ncbi:DUF2905 domain-containing protein [Persephonella sp.]